MMPDEPEYDEIPLSKCVWMTLPAGWKLEQHQPILPPADDGEADEPVIVG